MEMMRLRKKMKHKDAGREAERAATRQLADMWDRKMLRHGEKANRKKLALQMQSPPTSLNNHGHKVNNTILEVCSERLTARTQVHERHERIWVRHQT